MIKFKTALILDKRYEKTGSDTYPVRIRVAHGDKQYYLATGKSLTESEWKVMNGKRPSEELKGKLVDLNFQEKKAIDIIENMRGFSIISLRKKFKDKEGSESVKSHFNRYMKQLWEGGQIKSHDNYECALKSFERFKPGMVLADVTQEMLHAYHNWMLKEGKRVVKKDKNNKRVVEAAPNSLTAVSIYVRCLRTIINKASAAGEFPKELYPFGRYKYLIPAPRSKKVILPENHLIALAQYQTESEAQELAKDMWLFSYYNGGRNPVDIAKLENENIKGRFIEWPVRSKTQRTAPNQEPVIVEIHEEIRAILDRWAQKNKTYVFPVLKKGMDAREITGAVELFTHRLNDALALIAAELGIDKFTMGAARSTQANVQLRAGVPLQKISQTMGHQSVGTTKLYLKNLPKEQANEGLNTLRIAHIKTA